MFCSVKTIRTCYPQPSNGTGAATNRPTKLEMLFGNRVCIRFCCSHCVIDKHIFKVTRLAYLVLVLAHGLSLALYALHNF